MGRLEFLIIGQLGFSQMLGLPLYKREAATISVSHLY